MPLIFSSVIATLVTIPILGYIIIFTISKMILKNHRQSVLIASDFSTVLFIFSVHYIVIAIWGKSYFWLILLFMFFIAIIYIVFYWKIKQEIIFTKVFRGYWRLTFLLFLFAYIVLIFFGLSQRVFLYLSSI